MTKDQMPQRLYADYAEIKACFEADLDNLSTALAGRSTTKRTLQHAQEELKAKESLLVLSETHKESKVNGKNAETRARQTDVLLAHFRVNDDSAFELVARIDQMEYAVAQLDATIEVVKARLYSYQATSRMVAGIAAALAGA